MQEIVGPVFDRRDHAGFIRRTLAFAIDLFILCILVVAGGWTAEYLAPQISPMKLEALMSISFNVSLVIYFVGFRLSAAGTPGYRLMRIRYVYMLAPRPTPLVVVFRAFAAALLMCMFAIDHIWILFDQRKQAWHDKITGFYVVKRDAQPVGEARMIQRVISFMTLAFFVWEPTDERRFEPTPLHPATLVAPG